MIKKITLFVLLVSILSTKLHSSPNALGRPVSPETTYAQSSKERVIAKFDAKEPTQPEGY